MTEKDLEPLLAAVNEKSDQINEVLNLMRKEANGLKREAIIIELDQKVKTLNKEWDKAFEIYKNAALQYWKHDREIELSSSWRNFINRDERAPNSVSLENE